MSLAYENWLFLRHSFHCAISCSAAASNQVTKAEQSQNFVYMLGELTMDPIASPWDTFVDRSFLFMVVLKVACLLWFECFLTGMLVRLEGSRFISRPWWWKAESVAYYRPPAAPQQCHSRLEMCRTGLCLKAIII